MPAPTMHTSRLLVPVAVLAVAGLATAGCTSFTDAAPAPSSSSSRATDPTGTPTGRAGDLAVTDEQDLGVAAADVSAARLVSAGDDTAVLLVGATSTVVVGARTSDVEGLAPSDLVLVDGDPVVVGLAADPVAGDPVLALTRPDDAEPQQLEPQRTAPRGVPVFAVASGDVVHVLAEDADDLAATVLAVDPATGRVQDDVELDLSGEVGGDLGADVTSIDLVGLAATDGGLVAGLDVRTADGTSTGLLVALDADLQQQGDAQVLGAQLLALTADGAPVTDSTLADDEGTRVSGAASTGGSTVLALLDQPSPTVVVVGEDGEATTQSLCDGEGDALAVARSDDGTVLVAGTCDGDARLWTLA